MTKMSTTEAGGRIRGEDVRPFVNRSSADGGTSGPSAGMDFASTGLTGDEVGVLSSSELFSLSTLE